MTNVYCICYIFTCICVYIYKCVCVRIHIFFIVKLHVLQQKLYKMMKYENHDDKRYKSKINITLIESI